MVFVKSGSFSPVVGSMCQYQTMWKLNESHIERLVHGGAVLGGGGGGSVEAGMEAGLSAFAAGSPRIAALDESPDQAHLITLSRIGPVGQTTGHPGQLFDKKSALPLPSSQVRLGQHIVIFVVPCHRLPLSSPMADRKFLKLIEKLLDISFPLEPFSWRNPAMRRAS